MPGCPNGNTDWNRINLLVYSLERSIMKLQYKGHQSAHTNEKHTLYLRTTLLVAVQALWTLHLEAQLPVLNKPLSAKHNFPLQMSLHAFCRVNSMN